MNNAVEINHLTRHFKDFWCRIKVTAVKDVSFSVPTGKIFGLLGPNGSGKSTTLKLMLGLLKPSGGSVEVLGASPRQHRVRHRIGYLPEVAVMYRYLTATETLRFYASLFGLPAQTAAERTGELLAMAGLAGAAKRPVGEFSKGMNRRLGLAQALINDPDLIVLDEPTAGLDPMGCRHVKDLLRALAARGKSVVIASHLLADIEDVCDEIVMLHHGRQIAAGTLDDLLTQPRLTRFTLNAVNPQQTATLQSAFLSITGSEAEEDHPRLDLESFFIRNVREADHRRSGTNSGASEAGSLPSFLRKSS